MIGTIIASTIGLLIGLGVFIGTSVLIKQNKLKKVAIVVFYLLSFLIMAVAIYSLIPNK